MDLQVVAEVISRAQFETIRVNEVRQGGISSRGEEGKNKETADSVKERTIP